MIQKVSLAKKEEPEKGIFMSLYNRSYRLVAAVFLVVDVMGEENLIKRRIKEISLNTMSLCVELKDLNGQSSLRILDELEKRILELVSFLEVASISGSVSEMNASVLKSEFNLFLKSVSEFADNLRSNVNRSVQNIFADESMVAVHPAITETLIADTSSDIKDNHKRHNRKEHRRKLILDFLRTRKDVNIKEIAQNIRGCGEKTVQRELIELIRLGTVKRLGNRRWSRYMIA